MFLFQSSESLRGLWDGMILEFEIIIISRSGSELIFVYTKKQIKKLTFMFARSLATSANLR